MSTFISRNDSFEGKRVIIVIQTGKNLALTIFLGNPKNINEYGNDP